MVGQIFCRCRHFHTLSFATAALVLTGLAGCGPRNEFEPPPPPKVEVVTVVAANRTAHTAFPATTTAPEFVEIRARVAGFLQSVDFEEGGEVKAGQTLFQIEPGPFKAALDEANAQLATANADLELANQNYSRNYQLYQKKAISDLDLLKFKAELDRAKASVALAQAHVEAKQLDLSYTTVKAPFTGRASQRFVSVGNLVGAGENTLLTTLVQDDPMYVNFEVNERDVVNYLADAATSVDGRMKGTRRERTAELAFADGTLYDKEGVLEFADNRVDPDTGTLRMRATFPNPDEKLIPGLYVRILFPEDYPDSVAVPASAVQKDLGGDFILVVGSDNVVDQRYITPGPLVEGQRIILKGLEPGERVIARGLQKARDGQKVEPEDAPEPDAKPAPEAAAPAESVPAAESPAAPTATPAE